MGLLDSNSKKMLVESMRHALIKSVKSNKTLNESVQMEGVKFVKENATYEQLLNMTLNPLRESKYLPAHVLEGAAAIVSEAMLTGRKVIGVNALTEGALNLVEKTDCVVTESMLDAADQIAQSKSIYVVAEAIQRMNVVTEAKKAPAKKSAVKDSVKKAADSAKGVAKKVGSVLANITGINDLKNAAKEIGKANQAKSVVKSVDANLKGKSKQGLKNLGKATVKMMKNSKKEATDTAKKATAAAKKLGTKGGAKLAATAAVATAAGLGAKKAIKNWHSKKTVKEGLATKAFFTDMRSHREAANTQKIINKYPDGNALAAALEKLAMDPRCPERSRRIFLKYAPQAKGLVGDSYFEFVRSNLSGASGFGKYLLLVLTGGIPSLIYHAIKASDISDKIKHQDADEAMMDVNRRAIFR